MPPPEVAPVGKRLPHNAPTVKSSVTAKFTHVGDLRLHEVSPGGGISVPRGGIPAPRKLSNRPTNYQNHCVFLRFKVDGGISWGRTFSTWGNFVGPGFSHTTKFRAHQRFPIGTGVRPASPHWDDVGGKVSNHCEQFGATVVSTVGTSGLTMVPHLLIPPNPTSSTSRTWLNPTTPHPESHPPRPAFPPTAP